MMRRLILMLVLLTSLTGYAVNVPKHVFIRASSCDGKIPSAVLTSFREEIRASKGYQLATSMTDDGGLGVVLTVYMNCAELTGQGNFGIASIATIYGQGRCVLGSCYVTSNEFTLRSALCGSNVALDCGRDLFRNLDDYWSGPNSPPLQLK